MRISDFLATDLVLPALSEKGKDEVMETLAARLSSYYPDIDRGRLTSALRERDRQVSTALADGVAIPHARLGGLTRIAAVFGRSHAGIDCGSHDGKPTHLFLLLVVPDDAAGAHLKLLATASRLLHDSRCRTSLMQAADEATFLEALRAEEARVRDTARAA